MFEVVSPGNAHTDRVEKLADHGAVESVRHHVLLEQDRMMATVHARGPNGWQTRTLGPGAVLDLPAVGVGVPLAEFYVGVVFPAG